MGSSARRIGPGKQHPFPLPLAQFNSHSARATPCRHRPLGQLSVRQPGLGRGREGRRCLGGAAAAIANYKGRQPLRHRPALFLPPLSARHLGAQPMGTEPGKKGARVRMHLRKAMLPARGQRAVHRVRRVGGGSRAASSAPLASLEREPCFFFSWQFQGMLEPAFEGRALGNE